MVKDNLLKKYHLWSDVILLLEDTEIRIPKRDEIKEKDNLLYDCLNDNYVEPPLLYCHIIDLQVLDEDEDYQYCKVVKTRDVAY